MSRRPVANEDTEDGILKRWSKRKLRSGQAVEDVEPAREDEPESNRDADGVVPPREDRAPDEPVKTDEDMPDLDSIDEATNMSDFFSPGVSEQLRNQALRRLFRMTKFNVVDGLDDYNENFRNFAPLGDMVTSDMRHRLEMEEQRRQEAAAADAADTGHEGELADQAPLEETDREGQEPESVATDSGSVGESAATDDDEPDDNNDAPPRTET